MGTCLDCKRRTDTVIDHSSSDTICTECGLVIEAYFINDSDEWITFSNDDLREASDQDPYRVGAPTNRLLNSGGLATGIDKPKENISSVSNDDFSELCRTQNLVKNLEEDLIKKACKEIKKMAEDLELDVVIEIRACEIISNFYDSDHKRLRRRKNFIALCAASVSMACRELKLSRTLKEISTVAKDVNLKDIRQWSVKIQRLLASDQDEAASAAHQVIMNSGQLVLRFCSNLEIKERETKAIREAVEKAENFDIRRSPESVLASIIFMISQLSKINKRPIRGD